MPIMSLAHTIYDKVVTAGVLALDSILALGNLIAPKKELGHVIPMRSFGEGGHWPEYLPPQEGDSRSACPALNALANHGIIPHSGKVKFTDLTKAMAATFNLAPTLAFYSTNSAAHALKKDYSKDSFKLEELSAHNLIEHDASLCREDFATAPDQSKPCVPLINALLDSASGRSPDGERCLTVADLQRYSGQRRATARATNPAFSLARRHKVFSSLNTGTLMLFFEGKVNALKIFLLEERLPEGWEPAVRSRNGLSLAGFNAMMLRIEWGIKEPKPTSTET